MYRRLSAAIACPDDLALAVVFSLAGLDLSLWLLAKGLLLGAGGLFDVPMPL